MPQIVRMQNAKAFEVKGVTDVFRRAFDGHPMVEGGFDEARPAFEGMLSNPYVGVFVGAEKGEFKALAIVTLPTDKYAPIPQVPRFYSDGSPDLKKAMVKQVVDFVMENGYTRFWATNSTGKPDAVWERAFKEAGEMKPVGSIMEISIG